MNPLHFVAHPGYCSVVSVVKKAIEKDLKPKCNELQKDTVTPLPQITTILICSGFKTTVVHFE